MLRFVVNLCVSDIHTAVQQFHTRQTLSLLTVMALGIGVLPDAD